MQKVSVFVLQVFFQTQQATGNHPKRSSSLLSHQFVLFLLFIFSFLLKRDSLLIILFSYFYSLFCFHFVHFCWFYFDIIY